MEARNALAEWRAGEARADLLGEELEATVRVPGDAGATGLAPRMSGIAFARRKPLEAGLCCASSGTKLRS